MLLVFDMKFCSIVNYFRVTSNFFYGARLFDPLVVVTESK